MIKVMANENMEDWKTSPGVIDETVRVAKKFLEEHPEEVKKLGCSMEHAKAQGIGRVIVSEFLGWDKTRVAYSLERLGLIEEGIVEPKRNIEKGLDKYIRSL